MINKMEDQNKTKRQLINELMDLRQRIAGLEVLENERERAKEAPRKIKEATERLSQENAIMAEIGRIISSTLDINEVYERFAEEARKLIPFDRIMINLIDLKNNTSTPAYIAGIDVPGRRAGDITPLAGTVTEEVTRTRSSLLIQIDNEDIDEVISRFPPLLPTFQAGLRSLVFVPLISKDQVIGVLSLRSLVPKAYTDRDVKLAESIGNQIAGAIANAQLFIERKRAEEELQRSEEEAQRLAQENAIVAEIGRIISSTLDIKEVYERFAEEARKLIPFDRIMINLIDLKNNTSTTAYIAGIDVPGRRAGDITPLVGTVTEEVTRTRSSLLIQDNIEEMSSRFPSLLPTFQAGLRSLIFVPLISKDQVIGVLSLRSLVPKAYMDRDVRLAEGIGNQIAGAIANAQLFIERKRAEEELKKAYMKLKETQAQLIQSEKLASIGQLAAGVAHEINNPAGFVISNLDILNKYVRRITPIFERYVQLETSLAQYQNSELSHLAREIKDLRDHSEIDHILTDLSQIVSECLEGTHRIKKIVHNLRTFSHAEIAESKYAIVNDLLDSSLNLIWNEITHKAEVVKEYTDVPMLFCYPQQLRQVFLNILMNAVQAIEKRGKIIIKTYEKDKNIFIEMIDTGCGIPEELQNRIFEPFFTTKEVGKGTGLGLSIVYGIIKKHRGDIIVKSKIGEGTNFIIKLPIGGLEKYEG
jgi:two-component system NtrC family sensor kinase